MPRRQQMTLVELMVVMAILGILAAIVLPAFSQAKQRAQGRRDTAARAPASVDGQFNTIEVSELSESAERTTPNPLGRLIAPLLPLAFVAAVIFIILSAARHQMSRRA